MRRLAVGLLVLAACKDAAAPTPTGTIYFALTNCQAYATAEYVVDSTTVGIEPIVPGVISKGYSVPSGRRTTVARVLKTGATLGLWTFRDLVTVPENGSVTTTLAC